MSSSDLFMLRAGLLEAGMKEEAAEKVAVAMEVAVALTIDQVMEKWSSRIDARFEKIERDIDARFDRAERDLEITKRDMIIHLGTMILGSAGLIIAAIRWL